MRLSYGLIAIAALTVTSVPASADWSWITGRSGFDTGRYCAYMNTGTSHVTKDCTFNSFEQCRMMVISGNRGFCGDNPSYRPVKYVKKRRHVK